MYGLYENGEVIAQISTPMTLKSNTPITGAEALSLRRDIHARDAQRWELECELVPLRESANKLFALFVKKGSFGVYEIVVPQNYGVIANRTIPADTTLATTATGNDAGGTVLTFVSPPPGVVPVGTLLNFGHSTDVEAKMYMTTSEFVGNSVNIFPKLRTQKNSHTARMGDNVIGHFLLEIENIHGMVYTDGVLMNNGTLKFVEKV